MPPEGVDFKDITRLERAFAQLTGEQMMKPMSKAAVKIGEQLKERLMVQGGRPNYPLKWASEKQRRWYFASRKAAGLDPHYTRDTDPWSQHSRQAWAVEAKPSVGGALVGNRATYSPWVYSDEFQTEMHKDTGHKTDKQAVEEIQRSGIMARHIEAEIKSYLDQVFRGLG